MFAMDLHYRRLTRWPLRACRALEHRVADQRCRGHRPRAPRSVPLPSLRQRLAIRWHCNARHVVDRFILCVLTSRATLIAPLLRSPDVLLRFQLRQVRRVGRCGSAATARRTIGDYCTAITARRPRRLLRRLTRGLFLALAKLANSREANGSPSYPTRPMPQKHLQRGSPPANMRVRPGRCSALARRRK